MLKQSILLRMSLVGILGLLMLIPIAMVQGLVHERHDRQNEAVKEISEKWGQAQTLTGPILTVPVRSTIRGDEGTRSSPNHLHCLPGHLVVRAEMTPQIRYRGIYRAVLYSARLECEATVDYGELRAFENADREILWNEAFLTIGLSDLKGIRAVSELKWDGADLIPHQGLHTKDLDIAGFTAFPKINPSSGSAAFLMRVDIIGSESLQVVPVGKTTDVFISSPWSAPSFTGAFLPVTRNIMSQSFSATWKVLHLNRNYPQIWWNEGQSIASSASGVKLLLPVDEYQKNSRSTKYAVMFILLIFLAFLMTDILTGTTLHPIQYALVSFALVLFYALLLSLSEHVSFNTSYLVTSLVIVTTVSLYTRAITGRGVVSALIGAFLSIQYAFLFLLLQLEDWALLLGSVGLFVILALIMYLTRRTDWFNAARQLQADRTR